MGKRNRSPEDQVRRTKIRELLQLSYVSSMEGIQNLFKEIIAEFMQDRLDAEMSEDLGYSKYDYKNKATDITYNVITQETEILTLYGSNCRLLSNFIIILKYPLYVRLPHLHTAIDVLKLQSQNLYRAFIAVRA